MADIQICLTCETGFPAQYVGHASFATVTSTAKANLVNCYVTHLLRNDRRQAHTQTDWPTAVPLCGGAA